MVAGKQVIWIINHTWHVGSDLGQILWPKTSVSVFSVMHGEVWWPDSIMNLSLSVVPFLEIVSLIFLVAWMDLGQVDHRFSKFSLLETLIDEKIVFLMDSSVATLARSNENFISSSKSSGVESLESSL